MITLTSLVCLFVLRYFLPSVFLSLLLSYFTFLSFLISYFPPVSFDVCCVHVC